MSLPAISTATPTAGLDSSQTEPAAAPPTVALTSTDTETTTIDSSQAQSEGIGGSNVRKPAGLLPHWKGLLARRLSTSRALENEPLEPEPPSSTPKQQEEKGIQLPQEHTEERQLPTEPPQPPEAVYHVDIFPPGIRPYTSVDIIAVHDFDETPEDAWTVSTEAPAKSGVSSVRMQHVFERSRSPSPQPQSVNILRKPSAQKLQDAVTTNTAGNPPISNDGTSAVEEQQPTDERKGAELPSQQSETKIPLNETDTRPAKVDPAQRDTKLRASGRELKSKIKSLEESLRSSSGMDNREPPRTTNWIRDFLPHDIPQCRVLAFSYPAPTFEKKPGNWMEYVENAAETLLRRLESLTQIFCQRGVPVIFVGYGFGGIIVQKAIELLPTLGRQIDGGETKVTKQEPSVNNKKGSTSQEPHVPGPQSIPARQPSFSAKTIYQVILLDTPFPEPAESHDTDTRPMFPKNTNVRMTYILQEIGGLDAGSMLVKDVWAGYQRKRKESRWSFETTWLYSQAKVNQVDGEIDGIPKDEDVYRASSEFNMTFIPVPVYRHRRLARMPDPNDHVYRIILSKIQSALLFQAIKASNDALVETVLDSKPSIMLKDRRGRNPLHIACLMKPPSEAIVTLLINERPYDTAEPDDDGATPLHHAVVGAWSSNPKEGKERSEYSGVIRYLMRNMQRADLDIKNKRGMSPWDSICQGMESSKCVCGGRKEGLECAAVWIRELRENLEPITGPAIAQTTALPTEPTPPEKDSPRWFASFSEEGTVGEFYHATDNATRRAEEQINLKTASIYDMIYDEKKRCARILASSRRREMSQDFRCRWILLPANNEQWISDLFLSIGIHDGSLADQRYDGLTIFNRYMNPRAKKYQFMPFSQESPQHGDPQTDHRLPTVMEKSFTSSDIATGTSSRPGMPDARRTNQTLSMVSWATLPAVNIGHPGGDKTIAIFMPYLAYESHDGRKKMAKIINRAKDTGSDSSSHKDTALINGYIHWDTGPLHCRRTLDQYSYYMLETTERRDKDQVVYRWAIRNQKPKETAPILMVDQLWLWVLPDGTVITCLPNTQKPSEKHNIKKLLSHEIETNKSRHAIQSPDNLVEMILKTCLNIMTREGPGGVKLQEAFQSSINTIAESEAVTMKRLLKTVDTLAKTKNPFGRTAEINSFSKISEESRQLVEIIDIQDELSIIRSILTTQQKVLKEFQSHIRFRERSSNEQSDRDGEHRPSGANRGGYHETGLKNGNVVDESLRIVGDNISRVKEMDESAKRVEAELKQLLQFKQQQASGWDTRYAMKLSEQGQRQNTIMLVFTIVTVIFLPLSFIASFFTIAIKEFPKNAATGEVDWPVNSVSQYLFPISVGVSAIILLGIGLLFYRMPQKTKKRLNRGAKSADPRPWAELKEAKGKKKHKHQHKRRDTDDDSYLPDCTSDASTAAHSNQPDSSDDWLDGMSIDEDDEYDYAPLFRRWRFHTHLPGLRRLWLWKLYPVARSPSKRHGLGGSLERWEWDYPLRRWRNTLRMSLRLAIDRLRRGEQGDKKKNDDWERRKEGADDKECWSEDERMRSQTEEMDHRERVQGRKDRVRGLLGSWWGTDKRVIIGGRGPDNVDEGVGTKAAGRIGVGGLGTLFRRKGNRNQRWDEEMGTSRPGVYLER